MRATVKFFCLVIITEPRPGFQKWKLPSPDLQKGPQGSIISIMHISEKFDGHSFATAIAKCWSSCFLAMNGLASESGVSNGHEVFHQGSPLALGHVVRLRQSKHSFGHLTLAQHLSLAC